MQETLGVADVLAYQRAGEAVPSVVRRTLESVADQRPLIALGNSLGGIILFDVLREPDAPRPDLFVSVGSQAPALQTIDALGSGDRPPFQPWLNIYDPRDFFAFVAEPIWPSGSDIVDHRVDLGLGFPAVHGPAYFSDPQVFDAILGSPVLAAFDAARGTSTKCPSGESQGDQRSFEQASDSGPRAAAHARNPTSARGAGGVDA
jgi:hypothetical protein